MTLQLPGFLISLPACSDLPHVFLYQLSPAAPIPWVNIVLGGITEEVSPPSLQDPANLCSDSLVTCELWALPTGLQLLDLVICETLCSFLPASCFKQTHSFAELSSHDIESVGPWTVWKFVLKVGLHQSVMLCAFHLLLIKFEQKFSVLWGFSHWKHQGLEGAERLRKDTERDL